MEVVTRFHFCSENNEIIINNIKVTVVGERESPWFSGKEVCEALGYQNTKKALLSYVKTNHKIYLENLVKPSSTVSTFIGRSKRGRVSVKF